MAYILSVQEEKELKNVVGSLTCVVRWIEAGCTRGPEAEEVRLNIKKLEQMFPAIKYKEGE